MNWRCRSTKLFAIVYLNLEIYYIVREKLSNIFSHCVLANNVIHRTDAVHVWLHADVVSHGSPRW